MDGVIAAGRNAGRRAGAAGREADSRREAGRRSLEAAIELIEDGEEEGRGREMPVWREGGVVDGLSKVLFTLRSASRDREVLSSVHAAICHLEMLGQQSPNTGVRTETAKA